MILNTQQPVSNDMKLTFARSIKNKDELIHEYLETNNVDVATESDDLWLQMASVNTGNNKTFVSNRKNRRGGGLALITTRSFIKVTLIKETGDKNMQTCHWRIDIRGLGFECAGCL